MFHVSCCLCPIVRKISRVARHVPPATSKVPGVWFCGVLLLPPRRERFLCPDFKPTPSIIHTRCHEFHSTPVCTTRASVLKLLTEMEQAPANAPRKITRKSCKAADNHSHLFPSLPRSLLSNNRSDFLLLPGDLVCEEVLRDLAEVSELRRLDMSPIRLALACVVARGDAERQRPRRSLSVFSRVHVPVHASPAS